MKYKSFSIRNYKAIEKLTINLNNNVIPIIGVNESGKTSILQAILAFDKDKDNLLGGVHIDSKNKYKTVQSPSFIAADVIIEDEEEFQEIGAEINLSMDNPLYKWLETVTSEQKGITISRDFDEAEYKYTKSYSLIKEAEEISKHPKTKELIRALVKRLPNILYFDDFSDRVPESVSFPEDYVDNNSLGRGKEREWREIIVEIFSRAVEEEFSLQHFLTLSNKDDQENWLSDVSRTLDEEIINEWTKLKTAFSDFSAEDSILQLQIKYDLIDGKPTFMFKVIDNESQGHNRLFDVTQRSKGFQWFFNFIMKLKFNHKYTQNPENAIYLLDEPGSYLHSSAQTELLKKLCDIGRNNTIVYCTHSQYLLDPDVISIGWIKICSKHDGKIYLVDYGNSTQPRSLGAYSALNDALHLRFGFDKQILSQCILVEGIVDYYFYKMFTNLDSIDLIPGAGCSQLRELISILIACSERFAVVLDDDCEGRSSYKRYQSFFGKSFSDRAYQYQGLSNGNFVLEDILSDNDAKRIRDVMGCNDLKHAITKLYFAEDDIKNEIVQGFETSTKKQINIVEQRLLAYFKN